MTLKALNLVLGHVHIVQAFWITHLGDAVEIGMAEHADFGMNMAISLHHIFVGALAFHPRPT